MAKIIKRTWTSTGPAGRRVRHAAYGYTLQLPGVSNPKTGRLKQERKVSSAWLTEADALEELAKRQKAIAAGAIDRPDRTLGELAEEYLRYKDGKRSLKDDERIVRARLLPAFGPGLLARKLSAPAIAQYEKDRMGATAGQTTRKVSAFTVRNELGVLRHMLRLARRWGYIEHVPEIVMPKPPDGRLRYLDEAEIARLLAACRESRNPYLAAIMTIALHTGMRKGEILGLEWERVDLSSARVTLYHTKNGKPRGVPVNRAVYEALIELQPDAAQRHGRLFPNGNDRRGSQIRTAFEAVLKRAGIAGFRFHDLRHTAASHLVMRGASLQEVKEILGHSDLRMTLRYAHLSPAHLRGAVERLEGLTPVAVAHDLAHSGKMAGVGTPADS